MEKYVYEILSNVSHALVPDNFELVIKKKQIFQCLDHLCGKSIELFYCKVSFDNYQDNLNQIDLLKQIWPFLIPESNDLKKPIVVVFKKKMLKNEKYLNNFQSLVLIPKGHTLIDGSSLNNPSILLFFKDSIEKGQFPPNFVMELLNGYVNDSSMLMNSDSADIVQSENPLESGSLAIFNIFMFLMEGNNGFLYQNEKSYQLIVPKLNAVFQEVLGISSQFHELPAKIDDFEKILTVNPSHFWYYIENPSLYIDKSLFIKEFFNDSNRIIITRPHKWGKTMNLRMIENFFDVEVDQNGEKLRESVSKVLFNGGKVNFKGTPLIIPKLKIAESEHKHFFKAHQGRIPTIYFNFGTIDDSDLESYNLGAQFRNFLSQSFEKYLFIYKDYLVTTITIFKNHIEDDEEKIDISGLNIEELEEICEKFSINKSRDLIKFKRYLTKDPRADLHNSIFFLCRAVSDYFKKDVIVLIDNYDLPIMSSLGKKYLDQTIQIISTMLSRAFKDNILFVKSVLMTGVFPVPISTVLSGINHFDRFDILDRKFSNFFGVTDQELEKALENSKIDSEDFFMEIKKFYRGYKIFNNYFYCPWSISNSVCSYLNCRSILKAIRPFWVNSGDLGHILQSFRSVCDTKIIEKLMRGEEIVFSYVSYENFKVFHYMVKFRREKKKNSEENKELFPDAFCSLLLQMGYLTLNENNKIVMPNTEVKNELSKIFIPIWAETVFFEGILQTMQKLTIENMDQFKEFLQLEVLQKLTSEPKTKSNFSILLSVIPYSYASKIINFSHFEYKSENSSQKFKNLFIPFENKSNSAIIFKYKMAAIGQSPEFVLENSFWRIYVNKNHYLSKILEIMQKSQEFEHLKYLKVRAMVFFQDIELKWRVEMKEFVHDFDSLFKIQEKINCDGMKNDDDRREKILDEFLNIYQFLNAFEHHSLNNHDVPQKRISGVQLFDPIKFSFL